MLGWSRYGTKVVDELWLERNLASAPPPQPPSANVTVAVPAPKTELKDGESIQVTGVVTRVDVSEGFTAYF